VTVLYLAQIKRAAGCGAETIELSGPVALGDFLLTLGDRHDASFRTLLLDDAGAPRKSLLFFVGDEHAELSRMLTEDDTVTILAPMAGGSNSPSCLTESSHGVA
jgi:molybdopterin converting factor small subunit